MIFATMLLVAAAPCPWPETNWHAAQRLGADPSAWVEISTDSPPEAMMVGIDTESCHAPRARVAEYGRLLTQLGRYCEGERKHVADQVVSARTALRDKYKKEISIEDLLKASVTMLREAKQPKRDCAPALALLVVGLGGK